MDLTVPQNNVRGKSPGRVGAVSSSSSSLRKMECMSCKVVVFPPVWQCKYWHSVCNFCRPKLDTCPDPDCHESIDSASRSSIAEKFLEKHVVRCKYFNAQSEGSDLPSGCMEAKLMEECDLMRAHEAICYFREVKCLVPLCYKAVRFSTLQEHFNKLHSLHELPYDAIQLETSPMILKKQIINETCGERSYKTAAAYALREQSIFLVLFRMTSLRMPVFEIASIVHPYYSQPAEEEMDCRCEIEAKNEEDPKAHYKWQGPINQTYPLTPVLNVREELGKLKWIVKMKIT